MTPVFNALLRGMDRLIYVLPIIVTAAFSAPDNVVYTGSYSHVLAISGREDAVFFVTGGGLLEYDRVSQEWRDNNAGTPADSIRGILHHPFTDYIWVLHGKEISFKATGRAWQKSPFRRAGVKRIGHLDDALFLETTQGINELDPFTGLPFLETEVPDTGSITWMSTPLPPSGSAPGLHHTGSEPFFLRSPRDGNPITVTAAYTESNGNEWFGTAEYGLFYRDTYYDNISHVPHGLWKPSVDGLMHLQDYIALRHDTEFGQALTIIPGNRQTTLWFFPDIGNDHLFTAGRQTVYFTDGSRIMALPSPYTDTEVLFNLPDIVDSPAAIIVSGDKLLIAEDRDIWSLQMGSGILSPVIISDARLQGMTRMAIDGQGGSWIFSGDSLILHLLSEGLLVETEHDRIIDIRTAGKNIFTLTDSLIVCWYGELHHSRSDTLTLPDSVSAGPVNCMAAGETRCFAGNDKGVFAFTSEKGTWRYDAESSLSLSAPVDRLEFTENILYIGTKKGLYSINYEK